MSSSPVSCVFCSCRLARSDQRRRLFSASSEHFLPLIRALVAKLYGSDAAVTSLLPDTSYLCRSCVRALEKLVKAKQDVRQMEAKLRQQLQQAADTRGLQQQQGSVDHEETTCTPRRQRKRPAMRTEGQTAEDSPASKRRAINFSKSTPVRGAIRRMVSDPTSTVSSPAVAVSKAHREGSKAAFSM